jgi:hypothetical protein
VPVIKNLGLLLNINNGTLPFDGNLTLFSIAGNATSFNERTLNIISDESLIELHNGSLTFNLKSLTLDFDLGYEFVANPAFIADIGFMNLTLIDLNAKFDLTTTY